MTCPKSAIRAESLEFLERFTYWKRAGEGSVFEEEARVADALLLLNELWIEEQKSVEAEK